MAAFISLAILAILVTVIAQMASALLGGGLGDLGGIGGLVGLGSDPCCPTPAPIIQRIFKTIPIPIPVFKHIELPAPIPEPCCGQQFSLPSLPGKFFTLECVFCMIVHLIH